MKGSPPVRPEGEGPVPAGGEPTPVRRRPERVRRPADLLFVLVALTVLAAALGLVHALPAGSSEASRIVVQALRHIPRWLTFFTSLVATFGALALSLLMLGVLLRREARGALNAGVAAALAAGTSIAAATLWESSTGTVGTLVLAGHSVASFVIDATFLAFLTATDLVRRPRWWRWCVLTAGALLVTETASGALSPLGAFVVLLGGAACGWLVRWVLGAASLLPTVAELRDHLARHGLFVGELSPDEDGPLGSMKGTLARGEPIEVRVANRDTRYANALRALWALVRLRPVAAGHPTLSSRAELERLALSGFLAAGAGVLAPGVLLLTEVPGESLVLVTSVPTGKALSGAEPPEAAVAVFEGLRSLHHAGVAHRRLQADSLLVAEEGAGFADLDAALPGASELVRRLDVVQLLITLARLYGSASAVEAMRSGYRPEEEEAIVGILQPIALAPWGWSGMSEAKGCIAELRQELVGPGEAVPVQRLERFRWRTVLSAAALTIAGYVLIGEISQVDLFGAIRQMSLAWFAVAIVGSALTYLAAAGGLAAFVPRRLSLVRGFFVQLSSAFVGIAMPPTVGHVAVNARYLSRQDVPEPAIAAAVALSQIANVLTTLLLLLVVGLLTGSGISRFTIVPSTNVLIALGVIAGLVGILVAVPRTRATITHRVWPRLYSVWPRLVEAVSQPVRLFLGMAADLLLVGGYGLAFVASIQAVGGHAPILLAATVYLAGNAIGAAAPTPGGIGAVETVLAAGLTGIGVPAAQAIPATLVFRLATFWIPIPVGWVSFLVLQRQGTL